MFHSFVIIVFPVKYTKYNVVNICPVTICGSATGRVTNRVSRTTVLVNVQNSTGLIG